MKRYLGKLKAKEEENEPDQDDPKVNPRTKWVDTFIANLGNPTSPEFFFQTILVLVTFVLTWIVINGSDSYGKQHQTYY